MQRWLVDQRVELNEIVDIIQLENFAEVDLRMRTLERGAGRHLERCRLGRLNSSAIFLHGIYPV